MEQAPSNLKKIEALIEIVAKLRGPHGCPWDKQQSHQSLAPFAIEEAHELAEVLEAPQGSENDMKIKEELGDVLFQVILNTALASERQAFQFEDVLETICEKLIRRHPHVFSTVQVSSAEDVIANWQAIKAQEKAAKGISRDPISLNVPPLPSLERSYRIGRQTEKLAFDWKDVQGALEKVKEEINEFEEAIASKSTSEMEHELGDTLFSLAQLARHLELNPETTLKKANSRFEDRFAKMVKLVRADDATWESMTLEEKDEYWVKAKLQQKAEAAKRANQS